MLLWDGEAVPFAWLWDSRDGGICAALRVRSCGIGTRVTVGFVWLWGIVRGGGGVGVRDCVRNS